MGLSDKDLMLTFHSDSRMARHHCWSVQSLLLSRFVVLGGVFCVAGRCVVTRRGRKHAPPARLLRRSGRLEDVFETRQLVHNRVCQIPRHGKEGKRRKKRGKR